MTAAGSSAGAGSLDEIVEDRWTAYDKAVNTQGDQVVGRVPHLNAAGLYGKVTSIPRRDEIRRWRTANLLKMDKWSLAVNDSWVLGGIHRNAKFRLVSPRLMENLWNQNGFYVVTAREILGLLNFGYKLEQIGPWQVFICKNLELASAADLVKYQQIDQVEPDGRGRPESVRCGGLGGQSAETGHGVPRSRIHCSKHNADPSIGEDCISGRVLRIARRVGPIHRNVRLTTPANIRSLVTFERSRSTSGSIRWNRLPAALLNGHADVMRRRANRHL